jgi:hypothetical protein
MPRRRIDRFLNEALESFSEWLKTAEWWGKEHDCINLFAHKFLFEKIEPGAAIEDPTQVCIECSLRRPEKFKNPAAVKDLVIWQRPLQTTWSETWEPIHSPKAVMEWKVFRDRLPKAIFDRHDEDWVSSYTEEQTGSFGYVVSVDLASTGPAVYWKQSKEGVFGKVRSA